MSIRAIRSSIERRAEQHLEAVVLASAGGVQLDDARVEDRLRVTQVRLRESELLLVLAEVALDPRELLVGEVVRVDGPLQVRVEPLDLSEDVARLSLLGRDRARSSLRRRGSPKGRHKDDQPRQRLPTKAGGHALPGHDGRTGRGPVRHEHGTLTTTSDDRKRQGGPNREFRSRVVTVPPVGEPGTGLRAGLVAASVAILVALQLPAASGAGAPSLRERAQQLRSENATLEGEAGAAWLSSVSLSTRLEQTRAALVRFRARTQEISAHRAEAQQTLRLARRTLKASQGALAERLRAMYEQDETDPMAVLMGATSVDDAITRIEGLHRMARQDHAVIAEAKAAKKRLIAATQRLASQEAQARETEAATAATVAALDATRREQQAQYASLQAEQRSNSAHISSLESQARELAAVPAPSPRGRTLTVLATGYSLSGHTATGVPVGYGIVAVDPSVIPLGTHLTVPGYGEGVAADTGGAVAGARIDLWFPTRAEGLAWGTRTVSVTLH